MTAAVQRQGGGRTPSGQATAPKKPVGRPKGAPSTMVKVRPPSHACWPGSRCRRGARPIGHAHAPHL